MGHLKDIDKDIVAILLNSVFNNGLISEMTYRNSLNHLRAFDSSLLNSYSSLQQKNLKECLIDEYTKSQG